MVAAPVGIGFELPLEIAGVDPREPRRASAIAASIEPVTGEAGIRRPRLGAAIGDHPAILGKPVERAGIGLAAGRQKGRGGREEEPAHGVATSRLGRLFPLAVLALAACKPPPDPRHFVATADVARGKAAIERAGCGSCHLIPGLRWPQGKVGPTLEGLSDRALIAGQLPNEPDVLAAYIRNAPSLVPDSAMPAMPVSEADSHDIAAYLYDQGAD